MIKRDDYLNKLIKSRENGMVKLIAGNQKAWKTANHRINFCVNSLIIEKTKRNV